jgi:hypothetical protein
VIKWRRILTTFVSLQSDYQSLNLINSTCINLQNDFSTRHEKLTNVKQKCIMIETFFKHEFKCHKKTKKSLKHERDVTRELIMFINKFELSKFTKSSFFSNNFQLDVLFKKNYNMRQKFYESDHQIKFLSYTMKRKKDCIIQLKKEKKRAIEKLKRDFKKFKSEFINFMSKNDDINIETTMIKKRKREFIFLIK